MTKNFKLSLTTGLVFALMTLTATAQDTVFNMLRSAGVVAANCLPNASGRVTISSVGIAENMHVEVTGLPPNTDFDFFVLQLPNAPFGMAWYQGDVETDSTGRGIADFTGRFSIETFIVAPGTGVAPVIHNGAFPDASSNPPTAPVHMFHVGLWFNSPNDASKAGCPATLTPFNGDHTAGIQALSTRNFTDLAGPLKRIK